MAEESTTALGPRTRVALSSAASLFFMGLITWTTLFGTGGNSLHESALSWSFVGLFGILAAMGLAGKASELLAQVVRR